MLSLLNSAVVFGSVELPPEIASQRVIDERTAADFIGVSQVNLERMRKAGVAPRHVRLSERRLGYRVCDVLEWLDARVSGAGEAA